MMKTMWQFWLSLMNLIFSLKCLFWRDANIKIKSLGINDSEGKITTVLIQLADEIGKITHGKVEIEKLPLQYDLANMAGTSRETISRTLHTFAKKGLVELKGSRLRILNYEKFKEAYI